MLKKHNVVTAMIAVEARAWKAFSSVVNNFFGNNNADNYRNMMEKLLSQKGAGRG